MAATPHSAPTRGKGAQQEAIGEQEPDNLLIGLLVFNGVLFVENLKSSIIFKNNFFLLF
jgi:hypothetical protein